MIENKEAAGFDFPDDLLEAEDRYEDLVFEVQGIQTDLGNKNRTHEDGTRFSEHEYWDWRSRAQGALRHRLDEQRALKRHVRDLRVAQYQTTVGQDRVAKRAPFAIIDSLVAAYREGNTEQAVGLLGELATVWEIRGSRLRAELEGGNPGDR